MYERITPMPNDAEAMSSSELAALEQVWKERRAALEDTPAYKDFLRKMQREWAIETGIIERLYTWDRGVTEVLIEHGIDASLIVHRGGVSRDQANHIHDLINDQLETIEGLFSFVKNEQPLTEHFIRSLHAQLTAHQEFTEASTPEGDLVRVELSRGKYKTLPNNPRRPGELTHEYCPPEFISDEMQQLVNGYGMHNQTVRAEVLSAWLHHRFTQIHPFQDGNGRVARTLASLVFLRAGLFPLVIRDADRTVYIEALETADSGDMRPLIDLFVKRQRDSILKALGIEQQVQQGRYAEQIISSAIQVLADKFKAEEALKAEVYVVADSLREIAVGRLRELADKINEQFRTIGVPSGVQLYSAWARQADANSSQRNYFYHQIVEVAKHFGYFVNFERNRSWAQLVISTAVRFEYVVSIHAYGYGENGVMAISAFSALRVEPEDGTGTIPIHTLPAATDLFQFNYAENVESIKGRFKDWLEDSVAIALAEWRRQLDT